MYLSIDKLGVGHERAVVGQAGGAVQRVPVAAERVQRAQQAQRRQRRVLRLAAPRRRTQHHHQRRRALRDDAFCNRTHTFIFVFKRADFFLFFEHISRLDFFYVTKFIIMITMLYFKSLFSKNTRSERTIPQKIWFPPRRELRRLSFALAGGGRVGARGLARLHSTVINSMSLHPYAGIRCKIIYL